MDKTRQWLSAMSLLTLPLLSNTASASPMDWKRTLSQDLVHHYVYYPAHRIYFEPEQRAWFWYRAGNWWTDTALPRGYEQFAHDGVYLDLETGRPYERQAWVEAQYGSPAENERRHHRAHRGRGADFKDPYPTVTARAGDGTQLQESLRA